MLFNSFGKFIEVEQEQTYKSNTPELSSCDEKPFTDSVLEGDEFLKNGIQLEAGLPAYSLSTDEIIYRGSVTGGSNHVVFDLWRMGQKERSYR